MSSITNEPILEVFIFETNQLLEQLEQIIICSEKTNSFSSNEVNEIFRIMHTIKGSSSMMMYNNISNLTHSIEDVFYFIRETSPSSINFPKLTDLVLKGADFVKTELAKIQEGTEPDDNSEELTRELKNYLAELKNGNSTASNKHNPDTDTSEKEYEFEQGNLQDSLVKSIFNAVIHFDDDCKMENIRAFAIAQAVKEISNCVYYYPPNKISEDERVDIIRNYGFELIFKTDSSFDEVREMLTQTVFLKHLTLEELDDYSFAAKTNLEIIANKSDNGIKKENDSIKDLSKPINQSMVSVNITKLDRLMDLVGELVISEAMVSQNPDLKGLTLDNFNKAARQHRKITNELQDIVMSIRMVPLAATFQKMNRIVRDMCNKQKKDVRLEIIGEETEVDKNIVEHLSDPLMHIIRNSMDHGIEPAQERVKNGKSETGLITLEAKNSGGDVLLIIKDDGRGLDKAKILKKARENNLITRPESDLTDREIFSFIFLPGFSTNDTVSEYSGRGVGMDVVVKNVENINGSVSVESIAGQGTTFTIKIPLTLAIMNGMTMKAGKSYYTLPIISIKESFKIKDNKVITDPDNNEMIMIRGECYPILRLHRMFNVETDKVKISDGIIVMAEHEGKTICILVDELIGEQQVVVKMLPKYITRFKKTMGIDGCTLLGDGSISLILGVSGLINSERR